MPLVVLLEDELFESLDDGALPESLLELLFEDLLLALLEEEVLDEFSDALSDDDMSCEMEGVLGAVLSFTERAGSSVVEDDEGSTGSENASITLVPAAPSAMAPMPAATPTQVLIAARRCGS